MASLSLPERHKGNILNKRHEQWSQLKQKKKVLTDAFHGIVKSLSVSAGIEVGSI